jgi:hypothetical protein
MGSRKFAIKILEEQGSVIIKCNGNSMRPMIAPQEPITLQRVDHSLLRIGDSVFVLIKGNLQVHKISNIDEVNQRYEISNNKGFVNGKVGHQSIYGLAVQVADRILISEKELEKRTKENADKIRSIKTITT